MPPSSFLEVIDEVSEDDCEQLLCYLNEVFEVQRLGGRVRALGGGEFLVVDVASCTHDLCCALRARFPLARVDIESCPVSLGGFMVRVRLVPSSSRPYIMTSVLVAVLAAAIAFNLDFAPAVTTVIRLLKN